MYKRSASAIALGGIFAALAVILMSLGGLIPIATYTCPVLCMLMLQLVMSLCGIRIAWAWYGAVSILSVLLSPDKEAAATFLFLGYYPIVKPWIDQRACRGVHKLVLFNASIAIMYFLLLNVMGINDLQEDFQGISFALAAGLVVMGNVTFLLLDKVLEKDIFRKLAKYGR